jgi:hypothetical protein
MGFMVIGLERAVSPSNHDVGEEQRCRNHGDDTEAKQDIQDERKLFPRGANLGADA